MGSAQEIHARGRPGASGLKGGLKEGLEEPGDGEGSPRLGLPPPREDSPDWADGDGSVSGPSALACRGRRKREWAISIGL
jgi:hypothetical protein